MKKNNQNKLHVSGIYKMSVQGDFLKNVNEHITVIGYRDVAKKCLSAENRQHEIDINSIHRQFEKGLFAEDVHNDLYNAEIARHDAIIERYESFDFPTFSGSKQFTDTVKRICKSGVDQKACDYFGCSEETLMQILHDIGNIDKTSANDRIDGFYLKSVGVRRIKTMMLNVGADKLFDTFGEEAVNMRTFRYCDFFSINAEGKKEWVSLETCLDTIETIIA